MSDEPKISMDDVILADGRYPLEAFRFLHEGLEQAVEKVHGDKPGPQGRHVTGRQMCEALRDLAAQRWGMLAPLVLGRWNIKSTLDFGRMVYLLIDHQFMKKTAEDSLEDFSDVFNLPQAFRDVDAFRLKS
ncbi:MAG: hypothetical protein LLG01_19870 [Planctomycetaceae bacterium]|nr:hypothetical protein [Planctomycetaceae bacterium]